MTTINRNEKGEVSIDGEMIATIPQGQSMLSILSTNGIVNGGVYSDEDHMIYVDGVPKKKLLTEVYGHEYNGGSGVKVWKPVLSNVTALEARYYDQLQAWERFNSEKWRPAFQGVAEVGEAHAKVSHEYEGDYAPWWLYKYSGEGISFDWVDEPKNPRNLEAGQFFYDVEKYSRTVNTRKWRFKVALETAIKEELDRKTGTRGGCFIDIPKKYGRQICLKINGRNYWYHAAYNRYGTLCWQILLWPENDVEVIEL